jgi:oligopeptide/dipeptide ABC transporter ATP-binding protein
MLLEIAGLNVTVATGGRGVAVLRDIDITLAPGRILGLVGESGAGKSMIGRVIAQLLPPGFALAARRLAFQGADLLALSPGRRRALLGDRIAFVPQEPLSALNPMRTIGSQFAEHLARLGVAPAERRRSAAAALEEVRLVPAQAVLDRYPFQLSGGMCQRVLIAMAFASDPALIIADEPTTALDVTTQAHIVTLIRRLQRAHNTGLVFITHDLRLAAHLCDEVLVLYAGDMVERGPAASVFRAPGHPYTAALKRATPALEGERRLLQALPDIMPGIAALGGLTGCRFAARCPVADPACQAAPPPHVAIAADHWVRCSAACRAGADAAASDAAPAPPLQAASGAAPLLRLERIRKVYGARRRTATVAVAEIGFTIHPGEAVGVVGESGSGKSTLARLVMGLEAPSAGRILLDGADVTRPENGWPERIRALQMVFQDPVSALNPRRRVTNLVTQALEANANRQSRAVRQDRARALLRDTGLGEELAPRFPPQLSGGQRQRVNIARALCAAPRLLVADEIVSGLDVSIQAQILNLLLRLRREHGVALLFISHDLSVVRYLCERVLVMQGGAIVEDGPTERVFAAPRHPYTRALIAAVPPDDIARPWPTPLSD